MPHEEQADWQLLAQVSHAYRLLTEAFMYRLDIHRAQALLLYQLSRHDGQTQSELAEQLSLHGATITSMLQRLESAGLVTRMRDPQDNRQIHVYLTELGWKMEGCVKQQVEGLEDVIFAGIEEENRLFLRRILNQLLDNMSIKR